MCCFGISRCCSKQSKAHKHNSSFSFQFFFLFYFSIRYMHVCNIYMLFANLFVRLKLTKLNLTHGVWVSEQEGEIYRRRETQMYVEVRIWFEFAMVCRLYGTNTRHYWRSTVCAILYRQAIAQTAHSRYFILLIK